MKIEKLWGGRFGELPPKEIIEFLSGRDVKGIPPSDERLISYDIWGNLAHALMLFRQGILSRKETTKIVRCLKEIESFYQNGKFRLDPLKEDVHTNIESFLIERLGIDFGGKIHTGRSRNDQIALDMRLYLRDEAIEFINNIVSACEIILKRAEEHTFTIMPGYTHHQHATPTTFGHLLTSFVEALNRDVKRFFNWLELFNKNPLGAAAGYGTTFKLDRKFTSKLLGFDGPTENVTDSITQRWEAEAELGYAIAMTMNHISSLAQILILLSTKEFNMVRLDDRHCSGSSIMPQKRNPCSLEVIKAKTSYIHGMLMSLLSQGKALFMGYNRDTQWTKYWIMDIIDEAQPSILVISDVIRLLHVNKEEMLKRAEEDFSGATSLMEWLVQSQSISLRKAKMVVEKAVRYSELEKKEKVSFSALKKSLEEMNINLKLNEKDIEEIQKPERVIRELSSTGTPSHERILEIISSFKDSIKKTKYLLRKKIRKIDDAKRITSQMVKDLLS